MENIEYLRNIAWGGDELAWLQSWGATSNYIEDAWQEVLVAKGYSSYIPQGQKDWLTAQTGIENRIDAEYFALSNGLYTFAPVLAQWDARDSHLMTFNSTKIISWSDRVNGNTVSQGTDSQRPTYANNLATCVKSSAQYLNGTALSGGAVGTGDISLRIAFKSRDVGQTVPDGIAGQGTGNDDGIFAQIAYNTNDKALSLVTDGVTLDFVETDAVVTGGTLKVLNDFRESGTLKSYLNGVLQSDTLASTLSIGATATTGFSIGTRPNNSLNYASFAFEGDIAQVTVFSGAPKASEELLAYTKINEVWG